MDLSTALPTFAIALREGVEAALVVGSVLALLQKSHQSHLNPWVYLGVGSGLGASVATGTLLSTVLYQLQGSQQPWAIALLPFLKLGFTLLAIGMLTWMLIWMTQQARTAKAEIEGALTQVLQNPSYPEWGIWLLIFIAVFREGLETALFIVAQLQQGWMPLLGAIAGIMVATLIGWSLFALGIRINLQQFFQGMGIFLLLIVGGLVFGACKQLDLAINTLNPWLASSLCFVSPSPDTSSSCILGPLLWDGHQILPERQFPGILLKTFLGYRDRLFLGQVMAYIAFMVSAGLLYWRSLRSTRVLPTKNNSTWSAIETLKIQKKSP